MSHRIDTFKEHHLAARHLLRWFGVLATATVLAATAVVAGKAHAGGPVTAQAVMLRPGVWDQGVGSYLLPAGLGSQPHQWPTGGWVRVTHKVGHLQVQAVAAPARGLPAFLHDIALQATIPGYGEAADEAEIVDTRYLRVPGTKLVEGRLPTVHFSSGVLRPKLDHSYALQLGETPFTLTVQNGLRSRTGVPYGGGALYSVAYGGETYTWLLGQHGWDSVVLAVADLDGDGKPDFIVQVGGNNSGDEFLLLSSRARPGRNAPVAVLSSQGC